MNRNFTARAQASTRDRDRVHYLNGLRLELQLLWQTVRSRSAHEKSPLPERFIKMIDGEMAQLSSALARDGSWLAEKPGVKGMAITELLHEEESVIHDLELFIGLAQQRGRQELAARESRRLAGNRCIREQARSYASAGDGYARFQ